MQIGSRPGQKVFQAKLGGDTFLVCDMADCMLYLYTTVETLLKPKRKIVYELQDTPYFWVKETGMMYVLSEVSQGTFEHVEDVADANNLLEDMEVYLDAV